MQLIDVQTTEGATLTNSTAETVLGSHVFPAHFWKVGKVVDVEGAVSMPSTNSTDTLNVRLRLGPTTLTGTEVAATGALDVADDDASPFRARLVCTATDTIKVLAFIGEDAAGTALGGQYTEVGSLDLEAAQRLEVTGVWSVAAAANQCALQVLTVAEGSAL